MFRYSTLLYRFLCDYSNIILIYSNAMVHMNYGIFDIKSKQFYLRSGILLVFLVIYEWAIN